MSNKTEHFPTDMREDSTEIVNPNRQLETGMRQDINSNTQIDKEGYYSILYNSIKIKQYFCTISSYSQLI